MRICFLVIWSIPQWPKGTHAWYPVGCDESQSGRKTWTVEIQPESWDIFGSIICNSKKYQQHRHCGDCNTKQNSHYQAERPLSFPISDHMPSARSETQLLWILQSRTVIFLYLLFKMGLLIKSKQNSGKH